MTDITVQLNDGATAPARQAAPADTVKTAPDVVVDSKGRSLRIKSPGILEESRLVRAMGAASTNAAYMTGYVLPAAMVVDIDGDPVLFPQTEREVEAAISRLGREGLMAVMDHITNEADTESAKASVKN